MIERCVGRGDLPVVWRIYYSDQTPFPLPDYRLRMTYRTGRGEMTVDPEEFNIEGNVITWNLSREKQITSGYYDVCLEVFEGDCLYTMFCEREAFRVGCHGDGPQPVEISSYASPLFTATRKALEAAARVPAIDDHLDPDSKNPVQNWVIYKALMDYYETKVSGSFSGERGKQGSVDFTSKVSFNGKDIKHTISYYKTEGREPENKITDPYTDTITGSKKTYWYTIYIDGREYEKDSVSVSAYYNTYVGFAAMSGSKVDFSTLDVRNAGSAAATFEKKNTRTTTPYFVVAIPEGVTVPTTYVMNGAPVAFDKIEGYDYNGIKYTVLYIGTYSKDTVLKVTLT